VTAVQQLPVTIFDPVTPSFTGTISTIEWSGVYVQCAEGVSDPQPTATGFVIEFHSDDGEGVPDLGSRLASMTVPIGETGQTEVPADGLVPCTGETDPVIWLGYDYLFELDQEITLEADVTVWISIQAVTPTFVPYWGWTVATSGPSSWRLFNGEFVNVGTLRKRVLSIKLDPI